MNKKSGFTLIELLVVIAIIALLLSIIIPSLKNAKRFAAAAVCLANENQLVKAWMLYAEDNDAKFVDGDTSDALGPNPLPGYSDYPEGRFINWVGRPMGVNNENINDTIDDKVRGYEVGGLWPYIEAPKSYHCPADVRFTKPAIYPLNSTTADPPGIWIGGYRTYSIGKPLSKRPAGSNNDSGEESVEISKVGQFSNSSAKIVFLEETDGYGWNHKTWNMNLKAPQWVDPFAILHNDSSTFAFADGHADRHKWVDQQTRDMSEAQQKGWSAVDPQTGSTEDWEWFRRSYVPTRLPKEW